MRENERERSIRILYTQEEIQRRVQRMGRRISLDYAGRTPLFVGALRGCFVFMADLVRSIDLPVRVDFVELSSYGEKLYSSGEVRILKDLREDPAGRDVILVEDIVDTGHTLNFMVDHILQRGPASLRIAAMLVKEEKSRLRRPVDYSGYSIEDLFVVGYGMDAAENFRNLPYIGVLE